MDLDESDLRDSAQRAARKAALELLTRVKLARGRMEDPDDPDALHDFRVAVRRLRSWLRAFRSVLRDTVPRRRERRVRRLARATGASRDLEVHIAWVEQARRHKRGAVKYGYEWMLEGLRADKAQSDLALRHTLTRDYDRIVSNLERPLSRFVAHVSERPVTLAAVAAQLLRAHASELAAHLALVSSIGDRVEAHEARIAAKRLRYLLEPLQESVDGVQAVALELGELQDQLGDLHDTQVFGGEIAAAVAEVLAIQASRRPPSRMPRVLARAADAEGGARDGDPVPGLLAMGRSLRRAESIAFDSVKSSWLGGGSGPLLVRVESVAAALEVIAKADLEIERKFLLSKLPDDMPPATTVEIHQGYLPGTRLVERVRRVKSPSGTSYYRTVKVGRGLERIELEEETSKRIFGTLWPLTKKKRIRKRRYRVESEDGTWEIDEFLDRKLVLAEIEGGSPEIAPAVPDWLAAVVEREVTEEAAFGNDVLAK